MEKNYKIIKQSYWNERGEETNISYYIKERKSFWKVFEHWVDVQTRQYNDYSSWYEIVRFDTIGEAEGFIRDVLRKSISRDAWEVKEVKSVNFEI